MVDFITNEFSSTLQAKTLANIFLKLTVEDGDDDGIFCRVLTALAGAATTAEDCGDHTYYQNEDDETAATEIQTEDEDETMIDGDETIIYKKSSNRNQLLPDQMFKLCKDKIKILI